MKERETSATDLIASLWPEVLQTEESARAHPWREASRLGASPPAAAMVTVSRHADQSLGRLRRLAKERGHQGSNIGRWLGRAFSLVRGYGSDRVVSAEKSYRATVLGIHHGIGLVALLEGAALVAGDHELADFCSDWLTVRRQLCLAAEEALAWFAEHPAVASQRAAAGRPRSVTAAKPAEVEPAPVSAVQLTSE